MNPKTPLMDAASSASEWPAMRCQPARELLLACQQAGQSIGTLGLAMDGCIALDEAVSDDPRLLSALAHVAGCQSCQRWRAKKLQPALFAARKRVTLFCCVDMMQAVDAGMVALEQLGPELLPYWLLRPQSSVVRFCPWCGGRLPHRPFESDTAPSLV